MAAETTSSNPKLEADWSRGTWAAQGGMFFSGHKTIAEILTGKIPRNPAPLTAEYQQRAVALQQQGKADPKSLDPLAKCLPFGMPQILSMSWPFKFQFSADLIVLLSESGFRKVYMDAAPPPEPDELLNTYYGHSTGVWEGDTLVIKTVTLRGDTQLEPGVPHSWQLEVRQRWRQLDKNHLVNDITMIDPLALRTPWVVHKTYERKPDSLLREKQCI